jgi:hypothetical protein
VLLIWEHCVETFSLGKSNSPFLKLFPSFPVFSGSGDGGRNAKKVTNRTKYFGENQLPLCMLSIDKNTFSFATVKPLVTGQPI